MLDKILKTYTCHKTVQAGEITEVGNYFTNAEGNLVRTVVLDGELSLALPDELFKRYVPVPGDFFVVYADGYRSFSPRKAFLDGYKMSDDRSFADIKGGLKDGK